MRLLHRCVGYWPIHFFIEIHKFLRSVLLLGALVKIVVVVMGIVLLEAFYANCFNDSFYRGTGAGHLVNGGGLRSLRRARPHRASSLLIIYESMIKLGM